MAVWIVSVLNRDRWYKGNTFKVTFFLIHFEYLDKRDKKYLAPFEQIKALCCKSEISQTLERPFSAFFSLGRLS